MGSSPMTFSLSSGLARYQLASPIIAVTYFLLALSRFILATIAGRGLLTPRSQRLTAKVSTPSLAARARCVIPNSFLRCLISLEFMLYIIITD
jgi:hypothetical protein